MSGGAPEDSRAANDLAPQIPEEELADWAASIRAGGHTLVFTNGCYDLFHVGHVASLRAARAQGDVLLVGINSDASVRELKGPGRPVLSQEARAELVRSLRAVDAVTIFSAPSVLPTILTVRPDVVAKGGQYDPSGIVGAREVAEWGGRVVRLPMVEGVSTTSLIERIRKLTPTEGERKEDR